MTKMWNNDTPAVICIILNVTFWAIWNPRASFIYTLESCNDFISCI